MTRNPISAHKATLPEHITDQVTLRVEIHDPRALFDWWIDQQHEFGERFRPADFNPVETALECFFTGIGPSDHVFTVTLNGA